MWFGAVCCLPLVVRWLFVVRSSLFVARFGCSCLLFVFVVVCCCLLSFVCLLFNVLLFAVRCSLFVVRFSLPVMCYVFLV